MRRRMNQDRYIQFVSSSKNRHKFISDLSHFNFFKWDLFEAVKGNEEQTIIQTLQKNAVADKTCYVISENTNIDTNKWQNRSLLPVSPLPKNPS